MNDPRCLICGSEVAEELYRMTRLRVLRCRDCSQIYLDPLPSTEEIRGLFETLYTTGDGSVPELKDYYGFCFEDEPSNPLVQQYEFWAEEDRGPGRSPGACSIWGVAPGSSCRWRDAVAGSPSA